MCVKNGIVDWKEVRILAAKNEKLESDIDKLK
jgi:hypothetical protein